MKKRALAILLAVGLVATGFLVGCTPAAQEPAVDTTETETPAESEPDTTDEEEADEVQATGDVTTITFLSGKPEVFSQLQDTARLFMDANPDIVVEVIGAEAGASPYQTLTVMYSAGNAPSIFMIEQGDVFNVEHAVMDLSGIDFLANASTAAAAAVTSDRGMMAAPFAVESVGFIYNRTLIENTLGREFDPNSITSNVALEAIFQELEDAGVAPVVISPETWSLGAHYMMYLYANQFPNSPENVAFTEELRAGNVDLMENEIFNGWLDTFDIMKAFNAEINDPLAASMDTNSAMMAQERVAFYFMGTFTWTVMEQMGANPDDFGLMPVPVTADDRDANTRLLSIYSMYIAIDQAQNTPEQQEASLRFLEWLLHDEVGQTRVVQYLGILPAYSHITVPPVDPLNKSLQEYQLNGRLLNFNITYPSDHWQALGNDFQAYLADHLDRAGFAQRIQEFWINAQ